MITCFDRQRGGKYSDSWSLQHLPPTLPTQPTCQQLCGNVEITICKTANVMKTNLILIFMCQLKIHNMIADHVLMQPTYNYDYIVKKLPWMKFLLAWCKGCHDAARTSSTSNTFGELQIPGSNHTTCEYSIHLSSWEPMKGLTLNLWMPFHTPVCPLSLETVIFLH